MKAGWTTKRLGELCAFDKDQGIHRGLPYVGMEHIESHTGRFIGSRSPQAVKSATFRFSSAHVLYGRLRPYLNKAIAPDFEGHCSTEIFPIKPSPAVDRHYLLYWLLADETTNRINETCSGARMPRADMNEVLGFEFPFPPLPEQRRIVALLDEAFAGLATAAANAERNLDNARELFESHLAEVFSRRGDGWVETTLGQIGKVSMCKRIFKEQTSSTGDIPFYKIGTFGKVPDAFIPRRLYEEYRREYSFPKSGAVLLSASGTIGRRVIYDGEPAYFQDSNIVWIDNDESQILNEFLYHLYGACEWDSTQGATISRLYNDDLRRMIAAFPSSLGEQRRLASQLDALFAATQSLSGIYEQKQAALAALKRSLLHQAFNGEL